MQIKREIYNSLLYDCPQAPPEVGGILGGNENIINIFFLDFSINSNENNCYIPNTKKLNSILSTWLDDGINFYGIFHTHFPYGYDLSNDDVKYIHQIMSTMPAYIKYLFFPVIIPNDGMVAFKVIKTSKAICIEQDTITLI